MKRWMMKLGMVLATVAVVAVPAVTLAAGGPPNERDKGNGNGQPAVVGVLTAEQQAALVDFWTDEHKALATYQAVLAQFGDVQPFSAIALAEQGHIAALERIFARYGIAIPSTPVLDTPVFATQVEACTVAAQAETDNAALYDSLQEQFTQPDILQVIGNLRNASLNHHLPAFQSCAAGTYTGTGPQGSAGTPSVNEMPARTAGRGNPGAPRYNEPSTNCPVAQQ